MWKFSWKSIGIELVEFYKLQEIRESCVPFVQGEVPDAINFNLQRNTQRSGFRKVIMLLVR